MRCAAILLLLVTISPGGTGQEPARAGSPPAEQPRKVTSFPTDAVIVISENLQQALSAVPAGSVVLSAERYQALLEKLQRLEQEKTRTPATILLGSCRITGRVAPGLPWPFAAPETDMSSSRRRAELRLELEFRTEGQETLVPVPLSGGRVVKATLNGETPVWGPDSDTLTVLVKGPRICTLVIDLIVPILATGTERRLLLDRLPAAAVTTLAMTVPEPVRKATVKNGGPITITRGAESESRLTADALGMLSQFELTWQADLPEKPLPPRLEVTGEVQCRVEPTQTDTVAVLRFRAVQGQVTQCRLRLPPEADQAQVEEIKEGEVTRGEAAVAKLIQQGDAYLLTFPAPLGGDNPTVSLRLRWTQKTMSSPSSTVLGPITVLEPTDSRENGGLTVSVAPGLRPRLQPIGLVRIEARSEPSPLPGTVFAYRYGQAPVRLELAAEPAPLLPALAEVQLSHQLRVGEQGLLLSTELEILRSVRLNPQEIELRWPVGWTLSRGTLLSPLVEGLEHDAGTGLVRLRLATRASGPAKIKLMGRFPFPQQGRADWLLPYVSGLRGEANGKTESAQLLLRDGQLQIETEGVEARLESGTTGLAGRSQAALDLPLPLRGGVTVFQLPVAEAVPPENPRVQLTWQKRRPVLQARVEVYLHAQAVQVCQQFLGQVRPGATGLMEFVASRPLAPHVYFTLYGKDSEGKPVTRPLTPRQQVGSDGQAEISLFIPPDVWGEYTVQAEYQLAQAEVRQETALRLPFIRPQTTQWAIAEPVEVRCWCGAGLRLGDPGSGWTLARLEMPAKADIPPTLTLTGPDLDQPLELKVAPVFEDPLPDVNADRALIEVRPLGPGEWAYRVRVRLARVRAAEVQLQVWTDVSCLHLENVYFQRQAIPTEQCKLQEVSPGQARVILPIQPRWLSQSLLLDVRFQIKNHPNGLFGLATRVPGLALEGRRVKRGTTRWRLEPAGGELPLWQSTALAPDQSWQWVGWAFPPAPDPSARLLEKWVDPDALAPLATLPERPGYSYLQTEPGGVITFWSLPPLTWCGVGSLTVLTLGWLVWRGFLAVQWVWGLVAILLLLALLLGSGLLWAFLYAAQTGLVIFGGYICQHWWRQQRWKRQIVILPGFTRLPTSVTATASTEPNLATS